MERMTQERQHIIIKIKGNEIKEEKKCFLEGWTGKIVSNHKKIWWHLSKKFWKRELDKITVKDIKRIVA